MLDQLDLSAVCAVALDVDGTLAGPDSLVNDRTIEALSAVAALDVPVFLLTGRTRANTLDIARRAGLRHLVAACNGSLFFDPVGDADLSVTPMKADEKADFRSMADDLGLDLTWWTAERIHVAHDGPMAELIRVLNHEVPTVSDPDEIAAKDVLTMMSYAEAAHLDEVKDEVLRRCPGAMRSLDSLFEDVHRNATKWHALEWIPDHYQLDSAEVLGMGDGGNDVVWLREIGHPVAMGNARDEVKQVALAEAPGHGEDGVAVLLERLAAGRSAS